MNQFEPNCRDFYQEKNIFCSERFSKAAKLNIHTYRTQRSSIYYNIKSRLNFFNQIQIIHVFNPKNEVNLMNNFITAMKTLHRADYISYYSPLSMTDCLPENCKAIGFSSFKVELKQSSEAILKHMHQKHRNMVNSASKKNLIALNDNKYVDQVVELINSNLKKENQDQIKNHFINSLISYQIADIWVAKDSLGEKFHSCMIILKYESEVYYYHGGNNCNHVNGSMNYLHYQAMLYYKDQGFKYYDFMGPRFNSNNLKYIGLRKFKQTFGGLEVRGYLFKVELSYLKCKFFSFVLYLRNFRRSCRWYGDVIDQEVSKWTRSA